MKLAMQRKITPELNYGSQKERTKDGYQKLVGKERKNRELLIKE